MNAAEQSLNELAAMLETLADHLETRPQDAAVLRHDLHALVNGRDTIGQYDVATWAAIRRLTSATTPAQLTELIGPDAAA